MKKSKKNKSKDNESNATSVSQQEFEFVKAHDDLEDLDIVVESILSNGKDVEITSGLRVEIPRRVYYKMLTYAKLLDDEITGLGYVEKINNSAFKVKDVYLLKQVVSGAACKIDIEDQCALMQRLIDEKKDPGKLKFWWHSHAKMGAFWSSTDINTSEKSVCDYHISLVITHSGEMRCKININQPVYVEVDNVKVLMTDDSTVKDLIKECKEEVEKKVMKETHKSYDSVGIDYHRRHFYHRNYGEEKKEEKTNCVEEHSTFMVADLTFRWNDLLRMYDVFDASGRMLTYDEVERAGLLEYADPNTNEVMKYDGMF